MPDERNDGMYYAARFVVNQFDWRDSKKLIRQYGYVFITGTKLDYSL